jgi:dTDP-4-amino-4,6-dideoxygalactose transaminase
MASDRNGRLGLQREIVQRPVNALRQAIEAVEKNVRLKTTVLGEPPLGKRGIYLRCHPDTRSALHIFVVRVREADCKTTHKAVFERMRTEGMGVKLHYIPVYRQPYYERMGFKREDFPNAEDYYAEAITLPIFPGLTPEQQQLVIRRLLTPTGYQTIF